MHSIKKTGFLKGKVYGEIVMVKGKFQSSAEFPVSSLAHPGWPSTPLVWISVIECKMPQFDYMVTITSKQ